MYFKKTSSDSIGVDQIFFFDPDGNVIELSNCDIPIGMKICPNHVSPTTIDETVSLSSSNIDENSLSTSQDDSYENSH